MHDTLMIKGGTAVITGAASGIGKGLAHQAATLGMRLVLADINAQQLATMAAELDVPVLTVVTDVSDPAAVDALADAAWERFGRVDMLFNNAGVMSTGFCWEISPQRWERDIGVNIHGVLNGIRSFVPRLLKAGNRAHIINTASVGGFLPSPLMSPYSVSKFAVVALTESLQGELQMLKSSIGVSLLAPGPVQTGIFDDPFENADVSIEVQQFVDMLRDMLTKNGLPADELAQRVFAGIKAGQYWLLTQPEAIDQQLRQRVENILTGQEPSMAW